MADDRSKKLLSQDAIPKIEVPRTGSAPMREFRLPSVLKTGEQPTVPNPDDNDADAVAGAGAGKDEAVPAEKARPARGKRRSSTAKFRDRTLDWFKTGEELEDEEAIAGDYAPEERSSKLYLIAGGAVALAIAGALIIWLAS